MLEKMTNKEIIEVVQKAEEGEFIEYRHRGISSIHRTVFSSCGSMPMWEFDTKIYRVKPGPFECWVNIAKGGTVYPHRTEEEARIVGGNCPRIAVYMKEVI